MEDIHKILVHQDRIKKEFQLLSEQQLNWKPSPGEWSILQCIDHLSVSENLYCKRLEDIVRGAYRPRFFERFPLFTAFLGSYVVNAMKKPNLRMPAPLVFKPSEKKNLSKSILEQYLLLLSREHSLFEQVIQKNLLHMRITSPALSVMTFTLKEVLEVNLLHQARHIEQALRVKNNPYFPKN